MTWLGVFIHAEFTFRERVRRVVRSCFFQLRRIRQIRKHVNRHVTKPLVHAFVVNSSNGSKVCGTPANFNEFRNLAKLVVCRDRCSLRYRVGATSSEGSLAIDVSLPTSTNGSTGYTVHNQVNLTLTVTASSQFTKAPPKSITAGSERHCQTGTEGTRPYPTSAVWTALIAGQDRVRAVSADAFRY